MPWLNSMAARLEDQPPLRLLRASLSGAFPWIIVIAIWLALLAAYAKWRRYSLALPILAIFIGGGLYLTSNWPAPAPPGPSWRPGTALRSSDRAPTGMVSPTGAIPVGKEVTHEQCLFKQGICRASS
jgi:hypothetical protein